MSVDYWQKIAWREGMLLSPQHFQQTERFGQFQLRQRFAAQHRNLSGIVELEHDGGALAAGTLSLIKCKAVMPDGTFIDIPDVEKAPASYALHDKFEQGMHRLGIYLAVPIEHIGSVNIADEGRYQGQRTRWSHDEIVINDDTGEGANRDVSIARLQAVLLSEKDSLDGYVSLRIFEVERDPSGQFSIANDFVPACLHYAAVPALQRCLRRLTEFLDRRYAELNDLRRQRVAGNIELASQDAGLNWMLHLIGGCLPKFAHYSRCKPLHPEELYLSMATLAGELTAFAGISDPGSLPIYVHEAPAACFNELLELLLSLLSEGVSTRCKSIPLEQLSAYMYACNLPADVVDGARLYLGVSASVPPDRLMREVPLKTKIGSRDSINRLVAQAVRGVPLVYLSVPPKEIPVKPGTSYFELQRSSDDWQVIKREASLGFHIPPEFGDIQLTLLAVNE